MSSSSSHLLFLCTCAVTLALLCASICPPETLQKLPYRCTCMNPTGVLCKGLQKFPPPDNMTDFVDFLFENCHFETIGGDNIPDYAQAESLTLNDCRITTVQDDAFNSLTQLSDLQMNGNFIHNLSRNAMLLPQLKNLFLNQNSLSALPADVFNDLPDLEKLTMDQNNFVSLPDNIFEKNVKLFHVSLSLGKFTEIPKALTMVPTLRELDFNGNTIGPLTPDTFKGLPALTYLHLATCDIKTIDPQAFANQTKISDLYLSYNALREIPQATFRPMQGALQTLYIDNNKLTTLENGTLVAGTLQEVRLGHNPWHCDKNIAWMKDLHLENIDKENVTCATPGALRGQQLANVTRDILNKQPGPGADYNRKSMIAAAVAIPIIVICALLIFCILLRLVQNRRQRKRAQVRYSAVYRETTEPTKPGHHHHRPTSVI